MRTLNFLRSKLLNQQSDLISFVTFSQINLDIYIFFPFQMSYQLLFTFYYEIEVT